MRVKAVKLKNYRGFRALEQLDFDRTGKNVLVYGENGSGKSSLFHALKHFLNTYRDNERFSYHRNIFAPLDEDSYVELSLINSASETEVYKWSEQNLEDSERRQITAGGKVSSFLEYRDILKTHLLTPGDKVNLFYLLVETLLADIENPADQGFTFGQRWKEIENNVPTDNRQTTDIGAYKLLINRFNAGLGFTLRQLEEQLVTIFAYFGYDNVELSFNRSNITYVSRSDRYEKNRVLGQEVILEVKFSDESLPGNHPDFFNEAKLSAIGIAIYLAAVKLKPIPLDTLALLTLDDVLIGMDMSNRLPIIEIIREHFSSHQVFFLTYDREWFEVLREHFIEREQNENWMAFEFHCADVDGYESPIVTRCGTAVEEYIQKAESHFSSNDYKAAALYTRTAFETLLKNYCQKASIKIRFEKKVKKLNTEDFLCEIEKRLPEELARKIRTARTLVMNPLSHSGTEPTYKTEVQGSIALVKDLKEKLGSKELKNRWKIIDRTLDKIEEKFGITKREREVVEKLTTEELKELERSIRNFSNRSDLQNWLGSHPLSTTE